MSQSPAEYLRALVSQAFTASGSAKQVMAILPELAAVVEAAYEWKVFDLKQYAAKTYEEYNRGKQLVSKKLRDALDNLVAAIAREAQSRGGRG